MSKVRRVSFDGSLIEAPQITLHWKLLSPSFFELAAKKESSSDNSNEEDFEYLSNPGGYQLSEEQLIFLKKFYPEKADSKPFQVLAWLHQKAIDFQNSKRSQNQSQNLSTFSSEEEEEDDDYAYLNDKVSQSEDLQFLRFNKIRDPARKTEEDIRTKEKLAKLKEKTKRKKSMSSVQCKQPAEYKDVELKVESHVPRSSGNKVSVVFLGPSQAGKSMICGQILY